jgi:hypothetical protein
MHKLKRINIDNATHVYEKTITSFYKNRRNFTAFWGLMNLNTPENNRVSKEKR